MVGAAGNAAAAGRGLSGPLDRRAVGRRHDEHGCIAEYSNVGQDLDLVAPGGGKDADLDGDGNCHPDGPVGGDIYQETFTGINPRRFGLPSGYVGTSMAAPHVTATAALVIASGILGPNPTPGQVERRLEATATDLGAPGVDSRYGAGLVDAGRATDPAIPAG